MAASPSTRARNAELARIHIAKARLGLDDATYRAMLWTLARVHSAKDLDDAGRRSVLDHLRARGFSDPRRGRPHNADRSPYLRKIEALLTEAGRPWSYAEAMATRMFHVDRLAFASADQLRKLVAALSIDQRRRDTRGDA